MDLRAEVSDLVHRYCDAVTRRDLDLWAACWARDGRWVVRADLTASDPDARLAILRHAFEVLDGVIQMAGNGTVTPTGPGEATGRWYIAEHQRRTSGQTVLLLAHYDDEYVREDGQWRFASRTLVPHYQGPPDLSGPFSA